MAFSVELHKNVEANEFDVYGETLGAERPEEKLARLRNELFALSEIPMSDTDYMAGSGDHWKKLAHEVAALQRTIKSEQHHHKTE